MTQNGFGTSASREGEAASKLTLPALSLHAGVAWPHRQLTLTTVFPRK